jgi:iron complex outermembrane receptor protein
MKTTPRLPRALFGTAVLLLSASLAAAQAARPAPATPAAGDEIVTLREFNVTAAAASEYTAAESTTGTRVASTIRDLPFSVNVITGELLDDFQALEFRDQMAYTSNVTTRSAASTPTSSSATASAGSA